MALGGCECGSGTVCWDLLHVGLLGELTLDGTALGVDLGLGLEAEDGATPLARDRPVDGEVRRVDALEELGELGLVGILDTSHGNAGGGLLVGQLTEHGLVLHNSEGDTHLGAEGGEPQNKLKEGKEKKKSQSERREGRWMGACQHFPFPPSLPS